MISGKKNVQDEPGTCQTKKQRNYQGQERSDQKNSGATEEAPEGLL